MRKFKILFILFISFIANDIVAQKAYWQGGTPGSENSWTEAKNWINQIVPDEFTSVYIFSSNDEDYSFPVIEGYVEIAALEIHDNSNLTICEEGVLCINEAYETTHTITSNSGCIMNNGTLTIATNKQFNKELFLSILEGEGELILLGIGTEIALIESNVNLVKTKNKAMSKANTKKTKSELEVSDPTIYKYYWSPTAGWQHTD